MSSSNIETCPICCEVIDFENRFLTIGCCNHTGCCDTCYLRIRALLRDFDCIYCKQEMEYVIVVDSPISSNQKDHDQTSSRKLYEDYQVYDSTFISSSSERGDKFVFDEKSQVRSLLVDVDFLFFYVVRCFGQNGYLDRN